jgi:hypothetical protein
VTYLEVLQDIGGMVNDPNLDAYKDRAKLHFVRAINALIKSGDFDDADYAGYVILKTDLSFSTNPYDATSDLILKIISIFPDPATAKYVQCVEKDASEIEKFARNAEMTPSPEELFFWRIGNNIYAQVGVPSNVTLASVTFYMRYVKDIDDSGWGDATDLQATANYLSLRLVRAAIGVAVQSLEAEIAGE